MGSQLAALLLSLLPLLLSNSCHGAAIPWNYDASSLSQWPTLFKKWCGSRTQSPIKLAISDATYDTDTPTYELREQSLSGLKYQVSNDGHKINIVFSSVMPNVTIPGHEGSCFRPQSVHWHWGATDTQGSEHWLEGRQYPLEGHIVMWNCQTYSNFTEALDGFGGLAVLGSVYEPDTSGAASLSTGHNSLMGLLTANAQLQQCAPCTNTSFTPPQFDMDAFSLNDLLPSDRSKYYLYTGSLTTPDCRENVMWTVYTQPIRVPPAFLNTLRSLRYPNGAAMVGNFRPVLPLNPFNPFGARRTIVRSFNSANRASPPAVYVALAAVLGLLSTASR